MSRIFHLLHIYLTFLIGSTLIMAINYNSSCTQPSPNPHSHSPFTTLFPCHLPAYKILYNLIIYYIYFRCLSPQEGQLLKGKDVGLFH